MAKRKGRFNSSGGAPPQPRSLRSRKRECPCDDITLTVDVEAALHQQDTEGNNTAVLIAPPQYLQSPVQECAIVTNQLDQLAEQSYLPKQGDSTEEQHAEKTVKSCEGQEEHPATTINNDSQLQSFIIHPKNDTNKGGKKEIDLQDITRSSSDQHGVLSSEEVDAACAAGLEEQRDAKKNSQCNLGKNHETNQEEQSNMCMADVEEVTKESTVGLPARKKRRMGMCGLTEKERSHFLQTQKRENGQNGAERIEKQPCHNTADVEAKKGIISTALSFSSALSHPVDSVTFQDKTEIKLQSSHCGGENRAETEVCTTPTTSDRTSASCCTEGKSSEAEGAAAPDPEQTDEPKSNQPTEEKEEGYLENEKQPKPEESTGETPMKQRKDGDAGVDCSPVFTFDTSLSHDEEIEKKKDGSEAPPLQVQSVTRTRDEMTGDTQAEADSASTDTRPGGFSCGCVEPCEATVTPSNSERKDSPTPDVEPAAGSTTVNSEQTHTRDITAYLDYVSDSQLNSIPLIEEATMAREEDPGFSYCREDATNLICGLITELSSLNRKVMATHRELENLRRGNKTSRSSIR